MNRRLFICLSGALLATLLLTTAIESKEAETRNGNLNHGSHKLQLSEETIYSMPIVVMTMIESAGRNKNQENLIDCSCGPRKLQILDSNLINPMAGPATFQLLRYQSKPIKELAVGTLEITKEGDSQLIMNGKVAANLARADFIQIFGDSIEQGKSKRMPLLHFPIVYIDEDKKIGTGSFTAHFKADRLVSYQVVFPSKGRTGTVRVTTEMREEDFLLPLKIDQP